MLSQLVRSATASAADAVRPVIRDAVRRAVLLAIALCLLAVVLVFAELAFYLWLRTQTAPYFAALIVAGVTLLVTLAVMLAALSGRSSPRGGSLANRSGSRAGAADLPDPPEARPAPSDPVTRLAADAETLGRTFGRDAKAYQLILGAFVIGMMLGRGK